MGKVIENEQNSKNTRKSAKVGKKNKEKAKYKDDYINTIIVNCIEKELKCGTPKKTTQIALASACGVSIYVIRRCVSGYSTLKTYEQLKGLAEYTKIPFEELLESRKTKIKIPDEPLKRELPKDLVVNGIDIFSKESYNILCQHTYCNGTLFPTRDEFLIFLDYLIQQEDFILALSQVCKEMLDDFKKTDSLSLLADYKDYDDFRDRIKDKELSKKLRDVITDTKVRDSVRELVSKYLYDNLK